MKTAEQMAEIAERSGQKLPEKDGIKGRAFRFQAGPGPESAAVAGFAAQPQPDAIVQPEVQAAGRLAGLSADDLVARAEKWIGDTSVRLRSGEATRISAVIKPDAGTELCLELRLRNGAIEAEARLQSGNIENLQVRWPELQQQLSRQGIHLGPLTSGFSPGSNSKGNGHHQQQTAPAAEALLRSPIQPARGASTRTATSRSRHHGWETWA
jgi:hypothetical protein